MMALFRILAGISLLTLGRKLFWLFVAAIGFESGIFIASGLFRHESEWLVLIIAIVAGIVGALLAIVLQNLMIGVAGFLAGGYLLVNLLETLGLNLGELTLLPFVIGGVIGVALVASLFDVALIGLSSLTGAISIASVVQLPRGTLLSMIVIAGLFVVGVAIQVAIWQSEQRRTM